MSQPEAERASPAVLRAWVSEVLGPGCLFEDVSRTVGRLSTVLRIDRPDGTRCYLKCNESEHQFRRESHAYASWLPRLRDHKGMHVPEVVARREDLGAFLLTALQDAQPVAAVSDPVFRARIYERAGVFLRKLHDLDPGALPGDPAEMMRARFPRYVLPAESVLDPETYRWALEVLDDARPFAGARVVPSHRDYSERNWLVAGTGDAFTLSVIDWERAEVDVWLSDLQRMVYDVWPANPGLKSAFFRGYGEALTARLERQCDLAALFGALASVCWAVERGDGAFEALARETIARLQDSLA